MTTPIQYRSEEVISAILEGNHFAVQRLCRELDEGQKRGGEAHQIILFAILQRDWDSLIFALDCGLDPNAADDDGLSALVTAVSMKEADAVRQLLKFGANPNLADSEGDTPLHYAVLLASQDGGHEKNDKLSYILGLLLAAGGEVGICNRLGQTPIDLAIDGAWVDGIRLLLESNC